MQRRTMLEMLAGAGAAPPRRRSPTSGPLAVASAVNDYLKPFLAGRSCDEIEDILQSATPAPASCRRSRTRVRAGAVRQPDDRDVRLPRTGATRTFDPLDWIHAVTAHIPDPGRHQIRYYG